MKKELLSPVDDRLGVLDVKAETRSGLIDVEGQVQPHLHLKNWPFLRLN